MGRQVALTLSQIRNHVAEIGSIHKKMERTVCTEEFAELYERASPDDLIQLKGWIERNEYEFIRRWCQEQGEYDLHKCNTSRLRLVARRLRIKGWNHISKTDLIEAIELERRRRLFGRD